MDPGVFVITQIKADMSAVFKMAGIKSTILRTSAYRIVPSRCRERYNQEACKGEIQCPVLPNQICFLTNHNKFHVADLQLLLLSSNQKQWFTGNGTLNVVFTLSHS